MRNYYRCHKTIIIPFFTVLTLFCGQSSFSQNIAKDTLKINEIQISAQRSADEIGLVKTMIDTCVIQASKSESLSELLSENTSVFVKSAGRGALSSVSFRGTSASHTDVLWNGMSIKSPMLGEVDFSLIPMFLIDDVSLLYGGASIQSTSGALGGLIQIDNSPNWNNRLTGYFKQDFGSFSTINDYLKVNIGNKKIQSKSRIFYVSSKNDFEFTNKNIADINPETGEYIYPKQKNKNGDYRQYGWLQEFYFRLSKSTLLSLKYWGQMSDRALPRLNTYEGDDYSNISNRVPGLFHKLQQGGRHVELGCHVPGFLGSDPGDDLAHNVEDRPQDPLLPEFFVSQDTVLILVIGVQEFLLQR